MARPTILDVARRARVSVGVVSHVINNHPGHAGEATRRRVRRVIEQLGYRPLGVARSLRQRRTFTLGLVICDATSALFAPAARGVEAVARRAGYQVLLAHAPDSTGEREALAALAAHPVEGIIFMSVSIRQDNHHLAEAASRLPIAVINRYGVTRRLTRILWDDRAGAHLAVQHLLRLGHARIGFVAGPSRGPATRVSAVRRLEGFRLAHRAGGLTPVETLIVPGDYSVEAGVRAALRLCHLRRWPTAILAANDAMAMGVLRGVQVAGLRCPQDIAVVGIGDPPFMAFAHPPLTTVALPVEEAGARAAEGVLEQIANRRSPPRTEVLPCRLVVRESCGGLGQAIAPGSLRVSRGKG
ncbi:MAG: LacI family DNA-binding transcriptional regulator [Candidatus Methylomirabilales bacterium]